METVIPIVDSVGAKIAVVLHGTPEGAEVPVSVSTEVAAQMTLHRAQVGKLGFDVFGTVGGAVHIEGSHVGGAGIVEVGAAFGNPNLAVQGSIVSHISGKDVEVHPTLGFRTSF